MRVSIVTISYNQAHFLEHALLSVLGQDYPDLEYIVVDAGSTDGSRDIICKYSGCISKVIFEADRGPADGLNKGFAYATGDIYGFLNSDDYLLPGSVSYVVKCFALKRSIDVISGHALIVNEFGDEIRKVYSDRFDLTSSAYGACVLMQPSSFFLTSAYKKTQGFNMENSTNWDDELFLDIKLKNGSFGITNRFLSAYRVHSDSITGAASDRMHAKIQNYASYRFEKIMGRRRMWFDGFIQRLFLLKKYILNPLNVYERVAHGAVYRRYRAA